MTALPNTGSDKVFRLQNGRRITYRVYGAPEGHPVLALHGTPGSRLMYAIAGPTASRLGLRLIAPDRWAYGETDPHPEPSLQAWAEDAAEFTTGLGLDRFSVVGISGGSPYAAATAATLGRRVQSLALVVPVGPIAGGGEQRLKLFHRLAFLGIGGSSTMARLLADLYSRLLKRNPAQAIALIALAQSRSDRELLKQPHIRNFLAGTFRLGYQRNTHGPAIDLQLFSSPWQLDPAAVSARSRIWIGCEDRVVPLAPARTLAGTIQGATLTELRGQGHFWIACNSDQVLEWLSAERLRY